ncbi:helix-turn-helix domain-containing protein [Jiella pacifica]|uniref:Uncharacterized protein n=1 Tax=Jiella pacifica TaxID=2696469 RepID=A0A6N9T8B2_9HYPH|nr:helix-turn-helix domain-containing protein [Jiella pacifica]NDW07461.1 hypothetical protein [Jiella pacifica]
MNKEQKDPRSADIDRPPSRLGRLLLALRETVGLRGMAPTADPVFRKLYAQSKPERLSRSMAAEWTQMVAGIQISEKQIQRVETGDRRTHETAQIRGLLRSYGLGVDEVEAVIEDPELNRISGNPHLIADWRLRGLALYEFGPLINEALKVGDRCSTWLEVEKAGNCGYSPDEVTLLVSEGEINPPEAFRRIADEAFRQNDIKKKAGIRGWSDNPTLCLASVVDDLAADEEERRSITCRFVQSKYRYNVVAKQEGGAGFRARALQDATWPLKPVPFLSSGVGICINVICDDGKTLVVGRRGNDETFRKGEYDIAVVEGIRPTSNVVDGRIDIVGVAKRALIEELGLHKVAPNGDIDQIIEQLRIFELGCDLEYYQWNFLSYAKVNLNFKQIYTGWQKAKDRKENQTITQIEFTKEAVLDFVTNQHIWSSGVACAVRTFDYYT